MKETSSKSGPRPIVSGLVPLELEESADGAVSSNASVEGADEAEAGGSEDVARGQQRRASRTLGVTKRAWQPDEDDRLLELVQQHGPRRWSVIASHLPGRVGKQCRERCAHPAPQRVPHSSVSARHPNPQRARKLRTLQDGLEVQRPMPPPPGGTTTSVPRSTRRTGPWRRMR